MESRCTFQTVCDMYVTRQWAKTCENQRPKCSRSITPVTGRKQDRWIALGPRTAYRPISTNTKHSNRPRATWKPRTKQNNAKKEKKISPTGARVSFFAWRYSITSERVSAILTQARTFPRHTLSQASKTTVNSGMVLNVSQQGTQNSHRWMIVHHHRYCSWESNLESPDSGSEQNKYTTIGGIDKRRRWDDGFN